MSSGRRTHWCYQCRRAFRPRPGPEPLCPICDGGFIQELTELESFMSPFDFFHLHTEDDRRQMLGLMEAFTATMWSQMGGRQREIDIRGRQDQGMGYGPPPWFALTGGQLPERLPGNGVEFLLLGGGPGFRQRRANIGEHPFVIEELIEQFAQNERRGPPPASRSAIDAMPIIKINQRHLRGDSHCPVCMDKFELGTEAREMPCKHLYHSDCIVPWLEQHNSCPVCRYHLPPCGSGGNIPGRTGNRSSGAGGRNNNVNQNSVNVSTNSRSWERSGEAQGRRNPLSFLWPFRSSNSNNSSHQSGTGSSSSAAVHEDANRMNCSGWPSDY